MSKKKDIPPMEDDDLLARLAKQELLVEQLAQAISILLNKDKIEEKPKEVEVKRTPTDVEKETESVKGRIIPQSWLSILHKYLGTDFSFKLEEGGHGSFAVKIIFPKHIDRRIGTERSNGPCDVSMASPIRMSSPLDDLAAWCKLIVQTIKKTPGHEDFIPKQ